MRVVVTLAAASLAVAGCAQFTTSSNERAAMQASAQKAADNYQDCVLKAADRYVATGENATTILDLAIKDCSEARKQYLSAEDVMLSTEYMMPEVERDKAVKALDDEIRAAVNQQVVERKLANSAAGASAAGARPGAPAPPVPPGAGPAAASAYLDCMEAEGKRYAAVNEPAEVVAEVAASHCDDKLAGNPAAADLQRQGRVLVLGMVLDRKAAPEQQ